MRTPDISYLAFLALLAIHIWLRDSSWQARAWDTWPILAGIPIFIWFQCPWTFVNAEKSPLPLRSITGSAALYLLGVLTNLTMILALAWTLLFRNWLITRTVSRQSAGSRTKLLVLLFLSFPWVSTDLNSLGWAFRLSAAAGVEYLFSALHFDVFRQGTFLWVQGKPMSVEAACSGMNGLQSILIAGATMAYLKLRESRYFWWNIPLLIGTAWLANTLRIILLAFISVEAKFDAQNELLHELTGWVSLGVAFLFCWSIFCLQEPKTGARWGELARQNSA